MTCRAKFHIISLLIVPILILPDTGAPLKLKPDSTPIIQQHS